MQTELLIRFGKTVRKLRTQQNISQEAFADLCDLHRTYDLIIGREVLTEWKPILEKYKES